MAQLVSRRFFIAATGIAVCCPSGILSPWPAAAAAPVHSIPDIDGRFIRIVNTETKTQTIYGFNIDLADSLVPKDNDLRVFAYSVFIPGVIKSAGRSVKIVCKELIVAENVLVDLRGPDAFPDFVNRPAQNGQAPGQPGLNGANGGRGANGGDLTIVCDIVAGVLNIQAAGGKGGAAQNGGNGADGQAGPGNPRLGSTGGGGQAGGAPGKSGAPGSGGNGGKLSISTVTRLSANQLTADVSEGQPGSPGANGTPGRGGPGGWGASGRECEWEN